MQTEPDEIGQTIHGGAGTIARSKMTPRSERDLRDGLQRTLQPGVTAHKTSALMEHCVMPLEEAAQAVIAKITDLGGNGGLIAIDKKGNISLPFNTAGMYRGYVDSTGQLVIKIY